MATATKLSTTDATIAKALFARGQDSDTIANLLGVSKTALKDILPDTKKMETAQKMYEAGAPLKDIAEEVGAKSHLTIASWAKRGRWDGSDRPATTQYKKSGRGKGRLPRNERERDRMLRGAAELAVKYYNSDKEMSAGLAIVRACADSDIANVNAVRAAAQQVEGSPFRTRSR